MDHFIFFMALVDLFTEKIEVLLTMIDEMEDHFEKIKSFKEELIRMIDEIEIDHEEEEETMPNIKSKVGRPRKYFTEEQKKEAARQAVRRSRQKKNQKLARLEQENQKLKKQLNSK